MPTQDTIVSTLLDNEEYVDVLEDGLEIEENGGTGSPWKSGWDYSDVNASPQLLSQMVQDGLLDVTRNSSRPNMYSLEDKEQVEQSLELVKEGGSVGNTTESEPEDEDNKTDIPDDLFDVVIGHEPVKDLLDRCINTDEQTHFRLQGESSTAKSVFLTELERLEGAVYRSASGMTEAGLLDILIEDQPKYLLFDEIDKAEKECYTPLYELTEHGRIQKTISGSSMNIELNCNLIVTLNHPDKLPEELRKRMIELKFEEYSDDEYVEIVTRVLCNKFKLDQDIASFIAEYQLEELEEKNVREPEQIAKLSKNDMNDVKKVIENIEDYR